MRDDHLRRGISRRTLLRAGGAAALAAGLSVDALRAIEAAAQAATPTTKIKGTELKILQWSHFVPQYDKWFDPFVKAWGDANGVSVTVDHINTADVRSTLAAEIGAGQGHDLVEHISPLADFEPSLLDLTDVVTETSKRHGPQVEFCKKNSFNPTTNHYYGFMHGWAPDPGDYRKSLWDKIGLPNGPSSWQELLDGGTKIKNDQGVQMGIGMSNEIDSNMAAQALLWCFGGAVQDAKEQITINSPESVAAVDYMAKLFDQAMTPEVFGWTAASNNQLLIAGRASYILNSISAYRTAQTAQPDVAKDIFLTPALKGPGGIGLANGHAVINYMIPKSSKFPDTAKEFLLFLIDHYDQAVNQSQLYHFPAWKSTAPKLFEEGGWLDADPYGSVPNDKLKVLKDAESWTTNLGHPGPANAIMGEVFGTFVLPNMFARAARKEMKPAEAVAWAESQIKPIADKWRKAGLVGGG